MGSIMDPNPSSPNLKPQTLSHKPSTLPRPPPPPPPKKKKKNKKKRGQEQGIEFNPKPLFVKPELYPISREPRPRDICGY